MDAKDAQKQIGQMINFIVAEATDKAQEIQKKGEEEFSIEVHRLITEQKEKVRQSYERKAKQIETQYAIAKSMAINKQRLEKIKARQEVMYKIEADAKQQLAADLKAQDKSVKFVTQLILQGLLMLLENEVVVRCRQADTKLVQACVGAAAKQYAETIKAETGATKACNLTIDDKNYLPADCLGGVVLYCQGGKISIDNTIDLRLKLVMEQDKPAIRSLLFPAK